MDEFFQEWEEEFEEWKPDPRDRRRTAYEEGVEREYSFGGRLPRGFSSIDEFRAKPRRRSFWSMLFGWD